MSGLDLLRDGEDLAASAGARSRIGAHGETCPGCGTLLVWSDGGLACPLQTCETVTAGDGESARADVERLLEDLKTIRASLWGDRDDAMALSELHAVESQIRAVEEALR